MKIAKGVIQGALMAEPPSPEQGGPPGRKGSSSKRVPDPRYKSLRLCTEGAFFRGQRQVASALSRDLTRWPPCFATAAWPDSPPALLSALRLLERSSGSQPGWESCQVCLGCPSCGFPLLDSAKRVLNSVYLYTIHAGLPLFWWKKPCFKWAKSLKEPC